LVLVSAGDNEHTPGLAAHIGFRVLDLTYWPTGLSDATLNRRH
jgi:hypothetical protein